METLNKSTGDTLFDLTSYVVDTHASRSAQQGDAKENTTLDTYGRGYETPLANYDPDTRSWKMCVDTLALVEPPSLGNLPLSGMTRNGTLYERPLLEVLIVENGSSLWPTPTTHGEITQTRIEAHKKRLDAGMKYSSRLTQAIALRHPEDVGYLSPEWTELLMGFPPGWTDLEA
jgi:hypothetical protein